MAEVEGDHRRINRRCHLQRNVTLTRHYGKNGIVYSAKDEERGFNGRMELDKYLQGHDGELNLAFETLRDSKMIVTYNREGTEAHLMYLC